MRQSHIAYDLGAIGTFQNIPLSLQIFVTSKFFSLQSTDSETSTTSNGPISNIGGEYSNINNRKNSFLNRKNVDVNTNTTSSNIGLNEAASRLLIWLTEGEKSVITQISASDPNFSGEIKDRIVMDDIEPNIEVEVEVEPDGASIEPSDILRDVDSLVNIDVNSTLAEASQPRLLEDIQMRGYQLQALLWMSQRESDSNNSSNNNSSQHDTAVHTDASCFNNKHQSIRLPMSVNSSGVIVIPSHSLPLEGLIAVTSPQSKTQSQSQSQIHSSETETEKETELGSGCSPHPLWCPVIGATVTMDAEALADGRHWELGLDCMIQFWWNRFSHQIRCFPPPRPSSCRGGILADEMGLGKTVMALALIASDYDNIPPEEKATCVQTETETSVVVAAEAEVETGWEVDPSRRSLPVREDPTKSASNKKSKSKSSAKRKRHDISSTPVPSTRNHLTKRIKLDVTPPCSTSNNGNDSDRGSSCIDNNNRSSSNSSDNSHSQENHKTPNIKGIHTKQQSSHQLPLSLPLPIPGSMKAFSPISRRKKRQRTINEAVGDDVTAGTLIVCPMSLLGQWMQELHTKLKKGLVCTTDHRETVPLQSYPKARKLKPSTGSLTVNLNDDSTSNSTATTGIFGVLWHRIILDEAHIIKNPSSDVARAAWQLRGIRRWVLTGTPVQNSLNDLYSLVKFLRHEPWDQHRWWKNAIGSSADNSIVNTTTTATNTNTTSITNNTNTMNTAVDQKIKEKDLVSYTQSLRLIHGLLQEIMLRRTKDSKDRNGSDIITLLPKTIEIMWIELSDAEKDFYQALMDRSKAEY
eukprot:gene9072-18795_t